MSARTFVSIGNQFLGDKVLIGQVVVKQVKNHNAQDKPPLAI